MKRSRPAVRIFAFLAPVLALAVVLLFRHRPVPHAMAAPPPVAAETQLADTAQPAHHEPQRVLIGLYLYALPEIDVKTNSYTADFYVWFSWKGDLDPTKSFELMNVVNRAELSKIPAITDAAGADKPVLLPNGMLHQEYHVQGRFGHPFPLADYPLDEQDVTIEIEDINSVVGDLVYVIDAAQSKVHPKLTVPGWAFKGFHGDVTAATYATTFGNVREGEAYSHASFAARMERPTASILAKTVLPLLVVILMTVTAFLVHPESIEPRASLTVTALISAVALQFGAVSELPPSGYLTLLDTIYIFTYAMILAATILVALTHRLAISGREHRALQIDKVAVLGLTVAFVGGIGLIVRFH